MPTFDELDLLPALQRALKAAEYSQPTEIQAQAIPHGLAGRDILGCAQTGTGKTAAFVLPILNHLGSHRRRPKPGHPHALILSPTRELAIQISDNISKYGRFLKTRATLIYGGVSQVHQVRSLRRGTRILVATPGRLLDLMQQGHIQLAHMEHFVLDEADRMLDMGFLPDLERIISELPDQRQSLFFSATLAPKITKLAEGLLRDPVSIHIAPEKRSLDQIEQFLQPTKTSEKLSRLTELLHDPNVHRAIVFIRTKRATTKVEKKLTEEGLKVGAIHGDKSQNSRQRTLMAFRRGKINILVATDVAARGIDVDDVSHVINYDLPEDAETYVHRIGRTGRAGAKGTAITFFTEAQKRDVKEIERYLGLETDEPEFQKSKTTKKRAKRDTRRKRPERGEKRGRSSSTRNQSTDRWTNKTGDAPRRTRSKTSETSSQGSGKRSKASGKRTKFSGKNYGNRDFEHAESKSERQSDRSKKSKSKIKPKAKRGRAGLPKNRDSTAETTINADQTGRSLKKKPKKNFKKAKKRSAKRQSFHFTEAFFEQSKKAKKKKPKGKKPGKSKRK